MRVILALACIIPLVASAVFEWRGANTNWETKTNWVGAVPTEGCPMELDMRGTFDVASSLKGVVTAGGKMTFPRNGRITLAKAAKISFKTTCKDAVAKFVGGQKNEKSNNFNCRTNYVIVNNNGGSVASDRVPCESDTVVIPGGTSVRVWANERINIQDMRRGNKTARTCQDVNSMFAGQFDMECNRLGDLHIADNQPCILGQEIDSVTNECMCFEFNECLTEAQLRDQAEEEREAAEKIAAENLADLQTLVTKKFEGTFTADALGVTREDLLLILNDPEAKDAFMEELRKNLAAAWGVDLEDVLITSFEITPDGLKVDLEGVVTAPKSALLEAGSDTVTNAPIILNIEAGAELSQLQKLIRDAMASAVIKEVQDTLAKSIEEAKSDCGSSPECAAAGEVVDDLADVFEDPALAFEAIKDCVDVQCIIDEFTQNPALTENAGVTPDSVEALAEALGQLFPLSPAVTTLLETASETATEANDAEARAKGLPHDMDVVSPAIILGQHRPRTDLAHVISDSSAPSLRKYMRLALTPFMIIKRVEETSFVFSLIFDQARRRGLNDALPVRGLNDALPVAFDVKFTYITVCSPSDMDSCGFKTGDPVYKAIQARLNDYVDTFSAVSPSFCFDFATGYNDACLQAEADLAYFNAVKSGKSDAQAKEIAKQRVIDIAKCGDLGQVNGKCIQEDTTVPSAAASMSQQAAINYDAGIVPTQPGQTTTANDGSGSSDGSTGGGSSSGSLIPIIAGAAGGGLLVIIIIFVVIIKRRAPKAPNASRDDRNVVAFENPMYDDPGQGGEAQVYDNSAAVADGLYDEPAYNAAAAAKQNPMYTSQEDLGKDNDNEAGGGYLDVAPQ